MPSMDDLHRLEAKGLARAKLRSRRRRVSTIRSRTIRGALAVFAVAWAIVFGQLAAGNDPALSRTHSTGKPAASEPAPEVEAAPESEVALEPESELEVEPEVEVEPEPAPVITSSS
jgi:hypothetical protein